MGAVPGMVLFEHASGYALFRVKEFEEVSALEAEVEASIQDVSAFNSVVNLVAFSPFASALTALTNINSVSEGAVTPDLKNFIESNLPKKTKKFVLGVLDSKLGGAIAELLSIKCSHIGVVPEIIRGIRFHFAKLVKGLTDVGSSKAQLGLGHAYSRAKVKFNVNKSDNMIIQSIALLDQLDKDVNTFSMRIREWYSYHFPELVKIVNDNYSFAKCVKLLKDRKALLEVIAEDKSKETEMLGKLEEILMDSGKAKTVIDAAKASMGMDISAVDLLNIDMFASRVVALADYRKGLSGYLQEKMALVAPNLATLIGDTVGARLISHAGSLTNLAKYPASTVQILGAEKALFRALKTKGNTPKYGLIFHSTFIGRAQQKNKGRISRYLANKCSLASRIDCFSDEATTVFGEKLKDQVEERLVFLTEGTKPRKNLEVMMEAMVEHNERVAAEAKKAKKKKKKRKHEEAEEATEAPAVNGEAVAAEEEPPKKKKKKKHQQAEEAAVNGEQIAEPAEETPKKKKKKKHAEVEEAPAEPEPEPEPETDVVKKKKKKKKEAAEEEAVEEPANISMEVAADDTPKK